MQGRDLEILTFDDNHNIVVASDGYHKLVVRNDLNHFTNYEITGSVSLKTPEQILTEKMLELENKMLELEKYYKEKLQDLENNISNLTKNLQYIAGFFVETEPVEEEALT